METVDSLLEKYRAGRVERIARLKKIIADELQKPEVQPGYPMWDGTTKYPNGSPITWCNRYVYNVLQHFGYSLENYLAINPYTKKPDKDWTSVNDFYIRLYKYGRLRPARDAQVCASHGVPAIIIEPQKGVWGQRGFDPGHVGILYPDDEIQDDPHKIAVANAGSAEVMGVKTAWDTFYRFHYKPKYFTLEP